MKKLSALMLLCCIAQPTIVQAGRRQHRTPFGWSDFNKNERRSQQRELQARQDALRKQQEAQQKRSDKPRHN